jgi:hypothetical protein
MGTCGCSIHPIGKDEWIASMRGSLARIFQSPVLALALKASAADCGERSSGLLANYDQKNCSWKTPQRSLLEDSAQYSEIWPSWGMTRDGACYPLRELVPRTFELDGGALHDVPTVTVHGNYNRKGVSKSSGDGLATYVKKWPTPTASAYKGSGPAALTRKSGKSRENDRLDHKVMATDGGQLNPMWVEWLMGWPIGATELKRSATGKCHSKPPQHTRCSTPD